MRVILMRHAEAGAADPRRWPDDRERPLTDEGRKAHRKVARALRAMGVKIDALLTSPLVRARQTADITARVYDLSEAIEVTDALGDRGTVASALERLGRCPPDGRMLCVGHEPLLSKLAAVLVSRDGSARIEMKKSGTIAIDCDGAPAPGRGALRFHFRPKELVALVEDG
ncbi:MAG: phosphohistidine phosphatase SixA [Candidatus Rokubacteria bacterium]|nr:phosphohistidine phosphatase SixA [Candidatus Rokubacteria bacterium]